MAESTVEQPVQNNRFYCHQCNNEISPKLPEFTCPTCSGGFIEEINSEPVQANAEHVDAAAQFSELWGRQFLQNFMPSASPRNQLLNDGTSGSSSLDEDEEPNPFSHPFVMRGRGGGPGTHISVRRFSPGGTQMQIEGGNLQSVLEQLLMGLTGRGTAIMLGGPSGGMAGNVGDYVWGEGGLDAIITQLMNQLEGAGPPPATQDRIDNLPSITIDSTHVEKSTQCSVCFDELTLGEVVKKLPCQHMYHKDCIVPWLVQHGTCPVCRKTLDGTDTTCDENVQSIPETLETMGLNSPRQQQSSNTTPSSNTDPSTGVSSNSSTNQEIQQQHTDPRTRELEDFDLDL